MRAAHLVDVLDGLNRGTDLDVDVAVVFQQQRRIVGCNPAGVDDTTVHVRLVLGALTAT